MPIFRSEVGSSASSVYFDLNFLSFCTCLKLLLPLFYVLLQLNYLHDLLLENKKFSARRENFEKKIKLNFDFPADLFQVTLS